MSDSGGFSLMLYGFSKEALIYWVYVSLVGLNLFMNLCVILEKNAISKLNSNCCMRLISVSNWVFESGGFRLFVTLNWLGLCKSSGFETVSDCAYSDQEYTSLVFGQ